jgi:hypothetical protein
MKSLPIFILSFIVLMGSSCSKEAIPELEDIAGLASGEYKGAITEPNGNVIVDQYLQIHRLSNTKLSVTPDAGDFGLGRTAGFEMNIEKHGAAIHQVLGSEENGTFTLDLALSPQELRFRLPNGYKFDGWRTKNYQN